MPRLRICIDTSVIGGCFDPEFAVDSSALCDAFRSGRHQPIVSDLLRAELELAPERVRLVLATIPSGYIEEVELDDEAADLADAYLREGVVPNRSLVDARHIAIATVCRADVLVSWNFEHVVNLMRIRGYNAVNLKRGYPSLEIRSPKEVLGEAD